MNKQYSSLASVYDLLNADYDYSAYASFIDSEIKENERTKSSLVLDLGCGTGKITFALRELGYDMTGVDLSPDMLSRARDYARRHNINDVLLLCQDMTSFELYGTVDACCSCLDSINYLTRLSDVEKCFKLVHNYLIPNGIFVFDINSEHRFKNVYGCNDYILENDGVLCAWHNEYNEKSKICKFFLSIFEETEGGLYERYDEIQKEKYHSFSQIKALLERSGFEIIGAYGDLNKKEIEKNDEKWFFVARCIK